MTTSTPSFVTAILTDDQRDVLKGFINASHTSKLPLGTILRINGELQAMGLIESDFNWLSVSDLGLATFGTPHALRILAKRNATK